MNIKISKRVGKRSERSEMESVERMIPEQKRFLDKRIREHAVKQPEIIKLKKLLVGIGGKHLVAPPSFERDLCWILDSGFVQDWPVVMTEMEPHRCHLNAAQLLATGKVAAIGTGYALWDDLWHQHSWGIKRKADGTNTIIETTGERERYFGVMYWGLAGRVMFAACQYGCNGLAIPASLKFANLVPRMPAPMVAGGDVN